MSNFPSSNPKTSSLPTKSNKQPSKKSLPPTKKPSTNNQDKDSVLDNIKLPGEDRES